MNNISKQQKKANIIGPRASFGLACSELKKKFDNLTLFSADTHTSAGLSRFKTTNEGSLYDVSIAEQALISIAGGYALTGGIAVATTFAPFITMRAYEMIRHNLGYMNAPLAVVGLASGLVFGELGYTHCCIEDVSILGSIPNISILSPIDPSLIKEGLEEYLKNPNPLYLRITGEPNLTPIDLSNQRSKYIYQIGKGKEVVVLTNGSLTSVAYDAINSLSQETKDQISIYGINKIYPMDLREIEHDLKTANKIVVIDEGVENGFPAFFLLKHKDLAHKTQVICHPKKFLSPGDYAYMLKQAGLSGRSIAMSIQALIQAQSD